MLFVKRCEVWEWDTCDTCDTCVSKEKQSYPCRGKMINWKKGAPGLKGCIHASCFMPDSQIAGATNPAVKSRKPSNLLGMFAHALPPNPTALICLVDIVSLHWPGLQRHVILFYAAQGKESIVEEELFLLSVGQVPFCKKWCDVSSSGRAAFCVIGAATQEPSKLNTEQTPGFHRIPTDYGSTSKVFHTWIPIRTTRNLLFLHQPL